MLIHDALDRVRLAPAATRGERGAYVGQLERVHGRGAQDEGAHVLFLCRLGDGAAVAKRIGFGVGAKAQAHRHIHCWGDADALDELDKRGVRGLSQGVAQRHLRRVDAGVLHAVGARRAADGTALAHAVDHGARRGVQHGVEAVALLERCSRRENLEHGTGAVAHHGGRLRHDRLVLLQLEAVVARGCHREDVAGVRARPDHVEDLGHAVGGWVDVVAYRLHCRGLHRRVEGGGDRVGAALDLVDAQALAFQVLQGVIAHKACVTGGDAAVRQALRLVHHAQRGRRVAVRFRLREVAFVHHVLQHGVAALRRALRVRVRVEVLDRLQQPHQQRRLRRVQFSGRDVEVDAGRGLDAVGVVSEGN